MSATISFLTPRHTVKDGLLVTRTEAEEASGTVTAFRPRETKKAPVDYRAKDTIEIVGLMIRWFGFGKDAHGRDIGNATLTDFENNRSCDLALVVQNVADPANETLLADLQSGDAIGVEGYLEMTGGESYFVVTAVTEMRRRSVAKDATVKAYFMHFEDESKAAQRSA